MPQWLKTEVPSLLHTPRLLCPQIFRKYNLYKGPLLRFYTTFHWKQWLSQKRDIANVSYLCCPTFHLMRVLHFRAISQILQLWIVVFWLNQQD